MRDVIFLIRLTGTVFLDIENRGIEAHITCSENAKKLLSALDQVSIESLKPP